MYSIKFDKEKKLLKKIFKHQLEELEKAGNIDDLDDVIRPFIVLGNCIERLLDTDEENAIETFYQIVSKEDWNGLVEFCEEMQKKKQT